MAKNFGIEDDDADRRMVASSLSGYLPRLWIYPQRGHGPPVILLITALLALGSAGLVALVPLIVGVLFSIWTQDSRWNRPCSWRLWRNGRC